MLSIFQMIETVAEVQSTVLVTGESGTGKEVVARAIHDLSPRAERPFISINCGAFTETLLESELFGYVKGSFTGANSNRKGLFEAANKGTIFLDEIGELDANLQSKLLRVLQERTLERVGGTRLINVDVRVIAATNRSLKQSVADGKFREDLLYRINTFPLDIPALRDRPGDIIPLARFFVKRAAEALGRTAPALGSQASDRLVAYDWPGNVRELENVLERAVILWDDVIEPEHLPLTDEASERPMRFKDIERKAIEDALAMNDGNRTKAAEQLGISVRTLQYRLKEYGLAESR
jgi:transcriptional regulator with PAS, ATPase and Fis domain